MFDITDLPGNFVLKRDQYFILVQGKGSTLLHCEVRVCNELVAAPKVKILRIYEQGDEIKAAVGDCINVVRTNLHIPVVKWVTLYEFQSENERLLQENSKVVQTVLSKYTLKVARQRYCPTYPACKNQFGRWISVETALQHFLN